MVTLSMTLKLKIKKLTSASYSMYSTTYRLFSKVNTLAKRLLVSFAIAFTIWQTLAT